MNYWLTTDTHLGHAKLVEKGLRPENFERKIFSSMKKCIKPGDIFIHAGDISFDDDSGWHSKIMEFPCKKWLILGNHDKRGISWYLNHGWDVVCDSIGLKIFGYKVFISHIPRKDYCYDINIHGHFHNTDHRKHEPEISSILTYKHVLLALENNNYQLWNLESVIGLFKKKFHKILDESFVSARIRYKDDHSEILIKSPYEIENGRDFTIITIETKKD